VKTRGHNFLPLSAPGLVQCPAGDPQARIALEFREQQLDEIGFESDIGINPEQQIAVAPQLGVEEALQHGLAARLALAAAGNVYDLDPLVAAGRILEQCGRGVARAIVDYDPAQWAAGLRGHALDQTRQEFFLVAGGSYCAISFHERYP
jgi:hypothetical protein